MDDTRHTAFDDDARDVLRYEAFVVDPETGEVIEGLHALDIDTLMRCHMESAEQEKQWKARKDVIGIVLRARLEENGVRKYTSEHVGTATIVPNQRRSAKTERLEAVAEDFGLDLHSRLAILRCARELSVTDLDAMIKAFPHLAEPVSALITTGGKPYVKVTPALVEAFSRVTTERRPRL